MPKSVLLRNNIVSPKGIMEKTYSIFAFLALLLVVAGCDRQLKEAINNYQGDGQIEYLEAPDPLGASGCSIKMPSFDLSKGLSAEYSLSGIPASDTYVVYLVVDGPLNVEQVQRGVFSYQIKEGEKILSEVSASLKEFVDTHGAGDRIHSFYYFDNSKPQGPYVSLGYTDAPIVIIVASKSMKLVEKRTAHIQIKFGGSK
jgi:hypothetical protein